MTTIEGKNAHTANPTAKIRHVTNTHQKTDMEITLQRLKQSISGEETIGVLSIPDRYECFVLEDQRREVKVMGDTRIPAGRYEIKLRNEGRIHQNYIAKFGHGFHKGTLWLQNVPGFQYILIHIGNTEADTMGCLLTGKTYVENSGHFTLQNSTVSYKELYPIIRDEILSGKSVFITIFDES